MMKFLYVITATTAKIVAHLKKKHYQRVMQLKKDNPPEVWQKETVSFTIIETQKEISNTSWLSKLDEESQFPNTVKWRMKA